MKINQLSSPRKYDFNFLHRWLGHRCGGDLFLQGIEADPYEQHNLGDLVVLSGGSESGDSLVEYLCAKLVPIYHNLLGHKIHRPMMDGVFDDMWEYKRDIVKELGNSLCMLLSALVPAASIFTLYFLRSMVARLAAIASMSLLFSLLMTFIIRGSRGETFAATTAFAALQVVFLGGSSVMQ